MTCQIMELTVLIKVRRILQFHCILRSAIFDKYKNATFTSLLIGYDQSATWFESDNFKELHPHVNFPYEQDLERWFKDSKLPGDSWDVFPAYPFSNN